MTVGNIGIRPTKVGDVLKFEIEPATGYARALAPVVVPAGGLSVGAVLELTTNTTNYNLVNAANVDNAVAVLVDEDVYNVAAGTHMLAVLTRGPAIVASDSLTFADDVDTTTEIASVVAALLDRGIKTNEQL